ncbi:PKD domain-containing protein, partial [bacterium]|nr:PKD domain-containing protein [bacterium]
IWSEVNRGDGDIDGWVQVADLTPVAFNWGASRSNPAKEWNLEVVDYYGNWVIGQDDADMINEPWYLTSVGGYRIEAFEDAQGIDLICDEYVDGPDYGQREDIANLPCSKDLGLPGTPNWYHSKTGQVGYRYWNSEFGEYFDIWVRLTPFDQEPEKNEGVSTDLILVPLRGPQRPEASFTANPKIGNAPLSVCFDARTSSDPDGYITKYSWDWDGDGTFDETFEEPDLPDDPIWWHEYTEPGLYEPSLKVEDNDSLTDELTRPYEIDVRDPATTNLIFFNAWRYNHHDPQLEDNFGLDVMQYMEQKVDDVTGEPYWAGRKGITLQVHVQDTVNDFCNLNGARIYIDMHEPEGMSEPMRVQHVFTDPLIIPYDGCWAPDDPIFQKWRYNSQSHEWETTGIELWLYRLGGFLDSHHLYHDAEYGQDDFAGLVVSPIWIQIDMLNPQFQWFDIGINYLGATTQTPPQDGAERIFALFFPLNEQIPAACDGMTVWFIMESPVGSPRCFFSDLASDDWNFNGIEDHFTVDFSLSEL